MRRRRASSDDEEASVVSECVLRRRGEESWGLEIGQREGLEGVWVREILEDSPAAASSLREGERIVRVDGLAVRDFHEAIERFGLAGAEVRVGIAKPLRPARLEEEAFEVAPRLWAVRPIDADRGLEETSLTPLLFRRGQEVSRGRIRVWDLGRDAARARAARRALARSDAEYEHCGWSTLGRLPRLRFAIELATAVGAWLGAEQDNAAVLCDSSGRRLPVALAAVAVLRVGSRLVGPRDLDDSAVESLRRFSEASGFDIAYRQLPPSFRRWLVNLDAAVVSKRPPNPLPLVVIALEASSDHDLHLAEPFFDIASTEVAVALRATPRHRSLVAFAAVVCRDEFSITLRDGDANVLRFADSSCFLAPGDPVLPKSALDVFPNFRDRLPPDFRLTLRLAPSAPAAPASPPFLVPPDDDALLALGNLTLNQGFSS